MAGNAIGSPQHLSEIKVWADDRKLVDGRG